MAEDIADFCRRHSLPSADEFALNLAAEELFTNSVVHGYKGAEGCEVWLSLGVEGGGVKMSVSDSAPKFDPLTEAAPPDLAADAETRQIGGLGVFFAQKQMAWTRYEYTGGKNVITMFRKISQ